MSTLNPKDKAAELVDTFRGTILSFLSDNMKDNNAKQCAIVSVKDEIDMLTELNKEFYRTIGTDSYQERCIVSEEIWYLQKVLFEIEKL